MDCDECSFIETPIRQDNDLFDFFASVFFLETNQNDH